MELESAQALAACGSCPWLPRLFFLTIAHTPVQAQTIKTAYVELPPYTYTDAAGSPQGSLIDRLAKVSADAGYSYTAESAPARRLFQGVADGQYDMFIGIKTAEVFQGTTVASQSVIARIELNAWGIGAAPAIKAKEDLAGKQVIVLTGYSYGLADISGRSRQRRSIDRGPHPGAGIAVADRRPRTDPAAICPADGAGRCGPSDRRFEIQPDFEPGLSFRRVAQASGCRRSRPEAGCQLRKIEGSRQDSLIISADAAISRRLAPHSL